MKNLLSAARVWLDVIGGPAYPDGTSFTWILLVLAIVVICIVVFTIVNKNKKKKNTAPEAPASENTENKQ